MSESLDFSWHIKTWEKFTHACSENHLPHAILLTGAQGVGKKIFAERMVKSLLCLNPDPETRQACNYCQGCHTYNSGANPDFMQIQLLEDKQQIAVDQIRQLSEFLTFSRSFDAFRVVLINPVEKMNQNAANSLLKSLEEPANNTVIILMANNIGMILPTIISRSQLLSIPPPRYDQASDWLKAYFTQNNQVNRIDKIDELLAMSAGAPLLAIGVTEETLKQKQEFAVDIINILDQNNSVSDIAKKWEKYEQEKLLNWQIIWTQDLLKDSFSRSKNDNLLLMKFKEKLSVDKLWSTYFGLLSNKKIIHTSVNPLMNLESMLLLWLQASLL